MIRFCGALTFSPPTSNPNDNTTQMYSPNDNWTADPEVDKLFVHPKKMNIYTPKSRVNCHNVTVRPIASLTLIQMAIKKNVAVRLGVLYDSQGNKRKQGGLPVKAPLPPDPAASYWPPESHI